MTWVLTVAGLVLLALGADVMIRGAAALGARLGVSPLWIGIVLVGFGTSTPELLTSVRAALMEAPGIAVGNVVGSNIANILFILGVAALIRPLTTAPAAFRRDMAVLFFASALLTAAALTGSIGRLTAGGFLAVFAAYLVFLYRAERRGLDAAGEVYIHEGEFATPPAGSLGRDALLFIGGLIGVLAGADLLVRGAVDLARTLGVSEAVIGLTIVAVGTSLPELTTSVVAAARGKADISFGNIVGSNLFNALAIVGITALVAPIEVPPEIVRLDIWVMCGAAVLLAIFAASQWVLTRWEAAVFLVLYVGYMVVLTVPSLRALLTAS